MLYGEKVPSATKNIEMLTVTPYMYKQERVWISDSANEIWAGISDKGAIIIAYSKYFEKIGEPRKIDYSVPDHCTEKQKLRIISEAIMEHVESIKNPYNNEI